MKEMIVPNALGYDCVCDGDTGLKAIAEKLAYLSSCSDKTRNAKLLRLHSCKIKVIKKVSTHFRVTLKNKTSSDRPRHGYWPAN